MNLDLDAFCRLVQRTAPRRIHVITSCTKSKLNVSAPVPAMELYTGRQHTMLKEIVGEHPEVDWRVDIVSAKHGLIGSDEAIAPYEETFSGLSSAEVAHKGLALGLPFQFKRALHDSSADLVLVLLSPPYLRACGFDKDSGLSPSMPVVFLSPIHKTTLRELTGRTLKIGSLWGCQLTKADCTRLGAGQVWLKSAALKHALSYPRPALVG